MLTRSKLELGEGELVKANPEIQRVHPWRRMVKQTPLQLES